MDRTLKYILVIVIFVAVMMVDFSSVCKHNLPALNAGAFTYKSKDSFIDIKDVLPANKSPETENPVTNELKWDELLDLSFQAKYNKEYDMDLLYPVFGPKISKLAGKKVRISGYMIPLEVKEGVYAVSQFTYASCFFCGGAGVESVVSLKFKNKPRRYKTDEYCTIEGTFVLNGTDVNDFIYIFKEAEEIKNK